MTNDKRCSYWFLTINRNAICYNNFIQIISELSDKYPYMEYSYIYHTKKEIDDVDDENHIHLVLYFKGQVRSFNTLKKIFNGAHIELTNKQRYYRCVQYLIHKNDDNKTKYNLSDIVSNMNNIELQDVINSYGYHYELFESNKLEEYILSCISSDKPNIYYFFERFGIDAIKPYYFIIKDLISVGKNDFNNEYLQLCNEEIISESGVVI